MHQKQPAAKTAVFVFAEGASSARPMFPLVRARAAKIREVKCFVIGLRVERRSFIPKQMLKAAELVTIEPQVEIIPVNYFAPLDFGGIYGRTARLEVDLGCGDGSFLLAAAAANPERNFLGIDRLVGRVRSAGHKITTSGIANARVLRCEIAYAVRHLLPAGSVTVFHLLFPDPWPKRRHASRRIVTGAFLSSLHRGLAPGGTLRIATDQLEYFRQIERLASLSSQFEPIPERPASDAVSAFERRFRSEAIEIHRLALRKVSEAT